MTLLALFDNAIGYQLGMTLLHFLWQGLIIAILIWGIVHLYELRHGAARYNSYLLGLILMVAAPIVTFSILHGIGADFMRYISSSPTREETHRIVLGDTSNPQGLGRPTVLEVVIPKRPRPKPLLTETVETCVAMGRVFLEPVIPSCLVFWMVGVFFLSMRLMSGYCQTVFWRSRAMPLPKDLLERVRRLSRRFGLERFTAIYCSDHVGEALAVGILRPMILLPASWVTQMDPDMLEAIVAHELAHIRRHDLWVNLFQRIVETVLFYHPAVWWISRSIRQEREYCCDQEAADVIAGRATYADALHRAGQLKLQSLNALATGFCAKSDGLLDRVRHILGVFGPERCRYQWLAGLLSLSVMGVIVAPPVTAFARHTMRPADVERFEYGVGQFESADLLNRLIQGKAVDQATLLQIAGETYTLAGPNELTMHGIACYRLKYYIGARETFESALWTIGDVSLRIQCRFFLAKTLVELDEPQKARDLLQFCLNSSISSVGLTESQRSQALKLLDELPR